MTASGALAIVPVRVQSQRLPGKALLADTGRPLFLHTWFAAAEAFGTQRAFVATDDDRVAEAAEDAGAPVLRTSPTPRTGSERVAEALDTLTASGTAPAEDAVVVNVQGDWPEVEPSDLRRLAECLQQHPDLETATLAARMDDPERAADPNVVKVVRSRPGSGGGGQHTPGRALYFSRAEIPFRKAHREGPAVGYPTLRHIGVYAYRVRTLRRLGEFATSGLAELEALEQLRLLENGIEMAVLDATGDPWGIEARDDYEAFVRRRRNP